MDMLDSQGADRVSGVPHEGARKEASMSTITRARHGGHDQQPAPDRAQQKARALGLTSATGLVVGSIVGTGVFAMPAVLAGAGASSILVLGVIAVGAMLLAALFGQLTRRVPAPTAGSTPTPGKIEAVCRFIEATGKPAAVGRLADAGALLAGRAGTLVVPDGTSSTGPGHE
jgi:hypothetical protein